MNHDQSCECTFCGQHIDFELDDYIVDELLSGNVVPFVGGGVSTENRRTTPHSLYVSLAHELGLRDCDIPFADLTEQFTKQSDGRFKLIRRIQEHLDYVEGFTQLRESARTFSREMASIPYLSTFVTTNWDRYIEEECRAKPFTYETDIRFWNVPSRRVLKLHGTIDDYSTIVATRQDYDECERRLHRSLVGSKLKDNLATRTCIFVGYSLKDEDLQSILKFVVDAQGPFVKQHYYVSPFESAEATAFGLKFVRTDGTYFFRRLKDRLVGASLMAPDEVFHVIEEELDELWDAHTDFWDSHVSRTNPQGLISASYQDGLIHGYQRLISERATGRSSDYERLRRLLRGYEMKIAEYTKCRSQVDVAYFRGYQNSIISLMTFLDDAEFQRPPWFFHPPKGEMDREDYNEVFAQLPTMHKGAYRECQRLMQKLPDGHVWQHMPWG